MGQFKDQGDPALALAEECSEVMFIITKMKRFDGKWDEIPVGKGSTGLTRWGSLQAEMEDLLYQWDRLNKERTIELELLNVKYKTMARNMMKDLAKEEADAMFHEDIINEMEEEEDDSFWDNPNKDRAADDAAWSERGE